MFPRRSTLGFLAAAAAALLLGATASHADESRQERQQVSGSSSSSSRSASSTRSSSGSTAGSSSAARSTPSGTSSATSGSSSSQATSSSRQRARRSEWRDKSRRHYGGHHYYGGYSWGYHYYPRYWGYWYMPWFWGPSVSVYHEPYPRSRSSYERPGALDTDISPEKAEIYVDGRYVGLADDYDGFPTYLWLEEGTYDIAVYHPGFRTLTRQVSIYPGLVVDLDHRLEPGESIRPEDLGPKETPIRDERLRRDRERRDETVWRQDRGDDAPQPEPPRGGGPEAVDASGRLILEIEPGDAAVYLDGRFLGTGEEVGRLHAGLIVEPGEHQLSVVRPGYGEKRRRFSVEPGEEIELTVELDD